ncbi:hypothetical protein [Reinekea blandensis]|uniref:Uncharacterized protein n=1 Tax=Reinekea blandensis MED297 TaxID=314283 RepID=A4BBM5_9GAMM|nr:hypothetical protein [Reinekea blandensis]EAR10360.1 hypothetical protein MED297_01025 [Reinekea sp. MED297] [Reinekea blandensis MED297]
MEATLREIWHLLPSPVTDELSLLAKQSGQPLDRLLMQLLDASSHSAGSVCRMSPQRRHDWLRSPETQLELTRLCWRAHWVEPGFDIPA